MSRSGRSYTNVAILVRTPNPTVEGVLAGVTSPSSGALTGDVVDPAALAGATSPASAAMTADVALFRPTTLVVSLRPPPPRPNFMTIIRAPQPGVSDDGALAGSTSPASGALTGDVIDAGALAGATSPAAGALAGDVIQTTRPPAALVISAPRPAVYNAVGGLLTVGPVAVVDIAAGLAGVTSPSSGALTGDVIDSAALAGATSPATGALTGDVIQPSRPSTVLVVSSALAPARRPQGTRLAWSVPTEVSGDTTGALAAVTSPASGALTGTAASPFRPPAVLVVTAVRHAAYAFTGGLLTVGPVAPDTTDTAALAGATSPAAGALAGDIADDGALAGSTSPVSAAITTSTVIAGDLAGATSPASAALTADVVRLGPSPVLVATRPFPRQSYATTTLVRTPPPGIATGALAGTTSPAVGALAADVIDTGTLAGATSPASAALTTSSTDSGVLAGATHPAVGALTATSYYAATLAGTTSPTAGALLGTEYIPGAAAGLAPVLIGALVGNVVDAGALAGTALLPVAAFNRAPVIHYPLHAGTPVDHVTRYRAGTVVDNAAHYQAGEPT